MTSSPYSITLPPLPARRRLALVAAGNGIVFLVVIAMAKLDHYFWQADDRFMGGICLLGGVILLLLQVALAWELNNGLAYNYRLHGEIARLMASPLGEDKYARFIATARCYPEVQPWIADALQGKDYLTYGEALGLADRINAYLGSDDRRELVAMVRSANAAGQIAAPGR